MTKPIHRTVTVRCKPGRAFGIFTQRIDEWWPSSHRRTEGSRLFIEPFEGGRLVNELPSGEQVQLGTVRVWSPPERLVYTWRPGSNPGETCVEIRFRPDGNSTRVQVTHAEGNEETGATWQKRVPLFERAWDAVLPAFATFADGSAR